MKTITIRDDQTLKSIKSEFNQHFPHLKIEFFSIKHVEDEASPRTAVYDDSLYLKNIRTNHQEGEMSVDGHLKTSTFEQNFQKTFGVNVQVYRRSGSLWLQTITTDSWTLAEQERKGIQMEP